jgi:hypothetical protein
VEPFLSVILERRGFRRYRDIRSESLEYKLSSSVAVTIGVAAAHVALGHPLLVVECPGSGRHRADPRAAFREAHKISL